MQGHEIILHLMGQSKYLLTKMAPKNVTIQEGTKLFQTKVLLVKSSLNYSCTTFCSGHQSQNEIHNFFFQC